MGLLSGMGLKSVGLTGLGFPAMALPALAQQEEPRKRCRAWGIRPGLLPTGPHNAITDVAGVRVGHTTRREGERIRTGVTAVVPPSPAGKNLFQAKLPAALFVGNGFGKLVGATQLRELGQLETPILLTSTLSAPRVADHLITYMLGLVGNEQVRSINPIVGETNDGQLNDIRSRPLGYADVEAAITGAKEGPVEEGAVGAGTGTVAFGYKGGIGTASRRTASGQTVGALVQSNFGGELRILGMPAPSLDTQGDGSIMIVLATDAPLAARELERLAFRGMLGLGRTGASGSHGSGDYAIAFSTQATPGVVNPETLSQLFLAAVEATEEAIYNSLFMARTTTGNGRTVAALPVEPILQRLGKAGLLQR